MVGGPGSRRGREPAGQGGAHRMRREVRGGGRVAAGRVRRPGNWAWGCSGDEGPASGACSLGVSLRGQRGLGFSLDRGCGGSLVSEGSS